MATVADFSAQLAVAFADFDGAPIRLLSDYLEEHESIPIGAIRFQIRANGAGEVGESNVQYQAVHVLVVFAHRLTRPFEERAYTLGTMQDHLASLSDASFWRGLAAVYDVLEAPSFEVSRVGHVIRYTAETRVSLNP